MKKNKTHIKVEERRRYLRRKESFTVTLCSTEYLFKKNLLTKDISEDGICLLSPYKIEIGEIIELCIYLPESKKPVTARGKVLRRNEVNDKNYPFIMGIQFVDIPGDDYKQILKHLRYYFVENTRP